MLAASANLPIVNFDLRTQFTVAPFVTLSPEELSEEIFIPEGETTFDNTDPDSLQIPGEELVPDGEVFENPAPAASPTRTLIP
jgi:hypothetical protein